MSDQNDSADRTPHIRDDWTLFEDAAGKLAIERAKTIARFLDEKRARILELVRERYGFEGVEAAAYAFGILVGLAEAVA